MDGIRPIFLFIFIIKIDLKQLNFPGIKKILADTNWQHVNSSDAQSLKFGLLSNLKMNKKYILNFLYNCINICITIHKTPFCFLLTSCLKLLLSIDLMFETIHKRLNKSRFIAHKCDFSTLVINIWNDCGI